MAGIPPFKSTSSQFAVLVPVPTVYDIEFLAYVSGFFLNDWFSLRDFCCMMRLHRQPSPIRISSPACDLSAHGALESKDLRGFVGGSRSTIQQNSPVAQLVRALH